MDRVPPLPLTFRDRPERSRFEAVLPDGATAGFTAYEKADGRIVFIHTIVEPGHEGEGVGSALAREALEAARAAGLRVVPRCPFIRAWIRKHPAYADLADDAARA